MVSKQPANRLCENGVLDSWQPRPRAPRLNLSGGTIVLRHQRHGKGDVVEKWYVTILSGTYLKAKRVHKGKEKCWDAEMDKEPRWYDSQRQDGNPHTHAHNHINDNCSHSCAHVYSHVYMCTACLKPFFLSIETIDIVQLNTRIVYDDLKHYLLKKTKSRWSGHKRMKTKHSNHWLR